MKSTIILKLLANLLLLLWSLSTQSILAQQALGKNLNLVERTQSQDSIRHWEHAWNYPFQVIAEAGSIDDHAILLENKEDNQGLAYLTQEIPVRVNHPQKWKVTARFKTVQMNGGVVDLYAVTQVDNQWIQYKALDSNRIHRDTSWIEMSLEIWIQERAKSLTFGLYLKGQGVFIVDYFELEEIAIILPWPQEVSSFQQEVLDTIMKHSLYQSILDSTKLIEDWHRYLAGNDKDTDGLNALSLVLRSIDNHSFHITKQTVESWENTSSNETEMTLCHGKHIDSTYAYIWMPGVNSGDSISLQYFAEHLQELIDSLDHSNMEGWILDIRNNTGGNCWPMLAGIGPILGKGTAGYFQYQDGMSTWGYQQGASFQDSIINCRIAQSSYTPIRSNPPVAVLISGQTGSSGEIVATAFKNRNASVLIGTKTAGYTTGNINFGLSDGSMIFLASSYYADRQKNVYKKGIDPDIEVVQDQLEDTQLMRAIEWLETRG